MNKYGLYIIVLFVLFFSPVLSFGAGTLIITPSSGTSLSDGVFSGSDGGYRYYLTQADTSSWDFGCWGGGVCVGQELVTYSCGYYDGNIDGMDISFLYDSNSDKKPACPTDDTVGTWTIIETNTGTTNNAYYYTITGMILSSSSSSTVSSIDQTHQDIFLGFIAFILGVFSIQFLLRKK